MTKYVGPPIEEIEAFLERLRAANAMGTALPDNEFCYCLNEVIRREYANHLELSERFRVTVAAIAYWQNNPPIPTERALVIEGLMVVVHHALRQAQQ